MLRGTMLGLRAMPAYRSSYGLGWPRFTIRAPEGATGTGGGRCPAATARRWRCCAAGSLASAIILSSSAVVPFFSGGLTELRMPAVGISSVSSAGRERKGESRSVERPVLAQSTTAILFSLVTCESSDCLVVFLSKNRRLLLYVTTPQEPTPPP
eukprot:scaffold214108_cov28-Tisochrysis_lutea.AAC.4